MIFTRPVGETNGVWVITTYLEKGLQRVLLYFFRHMWYDFLRTAA